MFYYILTKVLQQENIQILTVVKFFLCVFVSSVLLENCFNKLWLDILLYNYKKYIFKCDSSVQICCRATVFYFNPY